VALLPNVRLIVLLGLIASFSAFDVLRCGLQGYRMLPLREGHGCLCKPHPKHAKSAPLVRIELQFFIAMRFD
jgi:hypothetical protein